MKNKKKDGEILNDLLANTGSIADKVEKAKKLSTDSLKKAAPYSKQAKEEMEDRRHNRNARLTKIAIFIAGAGIVWSIIYGVFIYPPKYVLDGSLSREYSHEFKLHFILRNINRGEGDVSKPILVITAKGSNEEYEVKPRTSHVSTEKIGENTYSSTTVDSGRTIHVGSYGIVDEFFEYSIRKSRRADNKYKEIVEFLRVNKDKLQFKIRGYPYKEISVILAE